MARMLSDIDLDEVSLVDIPAIKRKFLIVKRQEANMDDKETKDVTLEDVKSKGISKEGEHAKPKEETEKAGAKFSKEDKEKIRAIAKQILSLIEEEIGEAVEVKKSELDLDEILSYVKTKTKELVK